MTLSILLQAAGEGFLAGNTQIILLVGMFVVFYFFLIRPQQQKQKKLKEFRESLKKGDEILTTGGIYGKITSIENDHVMVEVDRGVKLKVQKAAVSSTTQAEAPSDK